MAIPQLNQGLTVPHQASAPADPFDTALIARLANELFSEREGPSPVPAAAPSLPSAPPTPPTALAGLPVGFPQAPSIPATTLPDLPTETPSDHTLTGGFPSVAPSSPRLDPSLPQPAVHKSPTPSGAHDPSSDAYAFGEPRCNGTVFAFREDDLNSKQARSIEEPTAEYPYTVDNSYLRGISSTPGYDLAASPEYYFLRGADSGGRSSVADVPHATPTLSVLDIEAIRRDFPALHQRVNGKPLIWLDNAATTHKPQSVIDATSRFYSRDNSNIHRAAHTLAARSTELFEAGREKVRQFLGAEDAKEIVFVRGTTEGINLVAQSYGKQNVREGDEIILSVMEHHANIVPWQLLSQQTGAVIRVAPMNDRGELIVEEFAKLLNPRTKIVSIAHVSNSLGTINPLEQIIPLAHSQGAIVVVDGAQSTPHIPISVQALDVDFFVFSAHKIFGPTGIGALYGKSHLLDSMPPWQGGGHMIKDVTFEKTIYQHAPEKFEAGTPDIAGVVGLGAAIDYLFKVGIPALAAYEHSLLEYATHALSTIPGLRPIGTAATKASVLSFVIPGVPNERIARHLDQHGIAVRAGHHCAMPAQRHFGLETTVRPSLAFYNTFSEVDALVSALHELPKR